MLLLIMTGHGRRNSSHLSSLSAPLFQRRDQLGVEERQQDQRSSEHHDEVEDVVVDDAEDAVLADVGEEMHRPGEASAAVRRRAEDVEPAVLEESRDVVEDRGGGHVADVTLTARQRAQSGRQQAKAP